MKKILLILAAIMTLGASSIFAYDYYNDSYKERHNYGGHRWYNRGSNGNYHNNRGYYGGCSYYGGRYNYQNLTQDQIAKIQELESKYLPQIDALRNEIYKQNQIINLEMYKENPDQSVINAAIDEKSKLSSDLQKLRIEFRMAINKVYESK